MSEPKLISPLLDGFMMGDAINEHHSVLCCPAIKNGTEDKYIVKIISVPASPAQMDALLLTGAYPDEAAALAYYKEVADDIIAEIGVLKKLSEQEGFTPYDAWQIEPMENGKGFDIYLLRTYNRTLERHFKRHAFTHLDALNLGLDICAALAVCRRSGYLYVGLKPGNIFVTEQQQYRIGGLGFIRLDSLKYASLPEKHRSVYTPGEISDAYSALNTTMDIYAAGLILYQAYNNGELPFNSDVHPGDRLPAPIYADYEMSEIILKACDPDPSARWQDPMQMGQAIVSYMQRNGAMDTPIVPVPTTETDEDEAVAEATDASADTEVTEAGTPRTKEETTPEAPEVTDEQAVFTEDEFGNFSFLSDVTVEDLEFTGDSEDYEELTGEVSEILNQADELAALAVPEPVIVPDHIELPELEPTLPKPEEIVPEEEIPEAETSEPVTEPEEINVELAEEEEDDEPYFEQKKKSHWLRNSVLVVLLLALLAGGYYFYSQHYLLTIDSIVLDGTEDSLTVHITTEADESLLQIICVDTYGNQTPVQVKNGTAEFSDLLPSTAYSIKVVATGFHKVTGSGTATYSTPVQTNIALFDAITGANDGSVILNFAVEGPDSKDWKIFYSAEGEEERWTATANHRATVNNLTVGKEYTFRLIPAEQLYISGQSEIRFTALKVVKARNLEIVSCMNNALVAKWSAPDGETVTSWTVSCSSGTYSQTITTAETSATFTDLDHTSNYTVEVKANYMSVGEKVSIAANTATVTNLVADANGTGSLKITWDTSLPVPAEGWKLHYSIAGIDSSKSVACTQNTYTITGAIPQATYRIWLTDANDVPLLSAQLTVSTKNTADYYQKFTDFELRRRDMEFKMCKTAALQAWDGENLADMEFTEIFATGESASFLVTANKEFTPTDASIAIMYVIRNQNTDPVYTSTATTTLTEMWPDAYCKLQIPAMPTTAGKYSVDIYFNGGLAATQAFTVT